MKVLSAVLASEYDAASSASPGCGGCRRRNRSRASAEAALVRAHSSRSAACAALSLEVGFLDCERLTMALESTPSLAALRLCQLVGLAFFFTCRGASEGSTAPMRVDFSWGAAAHCRGCTKGQRRGCVGAGRREWKREGSRPRASR
eukprot:scaffold323658_cov28-Tisochrysis_lutea.AAC.1